MRYLVALFEGRGASSAVLGVFVFALAQVRQRPRYGDIGNTEGFTTLDTCKNILETHASFVGNSSTCFAGKTLNISS